jgi:hypothetical protein
MRLSIDIKKRMWQTFLLLQCLMMQSCGLERLGSNEVLECDFSAIDDAQKGQGPALVADITQSMTSIPLNAVLFTDESIVDEVLVQGLFARRTATDSIEVITRIVNCTDEPVLLQARSLFMDNKQLPTEGSSVWQNVFLSPHGTGAFQAISLGTAEVAYYLVELRRGR